MEKLLEYLKKQREERVNKLEAYNDALSELEEAQRRVDAFGDIGGIEGEIDELYVFICQVEEKIAAAGATDGEDGGEGSEGGDDGIGVTEEA